ncbi:28022_t:CDS:2, partial [Gigaspora margarita]
MTKLSFLSSRLLHLFMPLLKSNAVAYCTQNTTNAPNTRTFPDGFIQTKHFASDTGCIQITRLINRSIYMVPNDGG